MVFDLNAPEGRTGHFDRYGLVDHNQVKVKHDSDTAKGHLPGAS
jgi:hypothetical protein